MRSTSDPSVHCDCRAKSVRNVRIITIAVAVCAVLVRAIAFGDDPQGRAACGIVIGAAFVTYGIATLFDETATFPKWAYAAIAVVGAALSILWASRLF